MTEPNNYRQLDEHISDEQLEDVSGGKEELKTTSETIDPETDDESAGTKGFFFFKKKKKYHHHHHH